MITILITTALGFALALPLLWIRKTDRKLTWTGAIGLGLLLFVVTMILLADVPSMILYYFDANHNAWAEKVPWLRPFMTGTLCKAPTCPENYIVVRDIVANTVQGIFFVLICVLIYVWGEGRRKAGKFKS